MKKYEAKDLVMGEYKILQYILYTLTAAENKAYKINKIIRAMNLPVLASIYISLTSLKGL